MREAILPANEQAVGSLCDNAHTGNMEASISLSDIEQTWQGL